ncbi:hypothetical protein PSA7680_00660 [Pseudoruegeria aquimaris]|uniref:YjiS-like domain-containing protein n=1 Tax=Pseudoruegeria aquimaris TaxID=393663 RepID=A0A1Y5RJ58_9RHOB|nr:DUF1127 domain-containing protein [Pseudoruegeria aquimaris]SLN18794.1 hypothetical protein PSA7680_00660 [Pseudoruegeria aquimaris]
MVRPLSQHARNIHFLESRHPLPPLSQIALTVAVVLAKWQDRARSRRALSRLTAHELKDIGLTREQAWTEARREFWRA